MLLNELHGVQIAERGVRPLGAVDLVDDARKVSRDLGVIRPAEVVRPEVWPAGQDEDGQTGTERQPVLSLSRRTFRFITKAFADAGCTGDRPASATSIDVEIVRKPPGQVGFAVHPRRWAVDPSTGSG